MVPIKPKKSHFKHLVRLRRIAKSLIIYTLLLGLASSYAISEEAKLDVSGLYDSFTTKGDIRRFAGETLYYDISFLWFSSAAKAEVGMYEKDGQYYATLQAETEGFVGFLTNYRKHVYETQFDVLDEGRRLRAKSFKRKVIKGSQTKSSEHFFDYETRKHRWNEYNYSDIIETGEEDIPAGRNFDDVLTVYYNIRNSVYGPLERGANFTIFTITTITVT